MTMDPTTLVTFLFKAPPEARAVELLGSWDNFTQPYPMHHDRGRGTGYWSGCFKFYDIIFDGDSSNWTKPRTGGLKQGGTYWYYYRLNDQVEAYDDSQNYTATCPLLPGQYVNVIDVPIEILETPPRCRSACYDSPGTLPSVHNAQTLDPGQKFAALNPPPKSKVHGRCVSDLQLNGRLETKAQSYRSSIGSPPATPYSVSEQADWPLTTRPQRYYSDAIHSHDSFSDYRGSLCSRRSWRSTAPSVTHSSIVDAYGADSNAFVVDLWKDLPPLPEASSPTADPPSKFPYEDEEDEFRFSSEIELTSPIEKSSVDGNDLEALFNPPPSAWDRQPSRSVTSYSGTSWPLMDLQSNPVKEGRERDNSTTTHDWTSDSEMSPRPSVKQHTEVEGEGFDMLSPTFSAATLSTGGLNTPFRLSAACPSSANAGSAHEHSIERVAERLRSLGSIDHDDIPPISEREEPGFTGYTLPDSTATQSVQSLSKVPSAHDSIVALELPLPSTFMPETQQGSFADDIFSELSFLGSA